VKRSNKGFTLVEIMVTVGIIGLLAAIAIPSLRKARRTAQVARFINDLRIAKDAFEMCATASGYPGDELPAVMPAAVSDYLPRFKWTENTAIGGQWDWDNNVFGYVAGVSVAAPNRSVAEMRDIDTQIDNGNLLTGLFRSRAGGYIYLIEE